MQRLHQLLPYEEKDALSRSQQFAKHDSRINRYHNGVIKCRYQHDLPGDNTQFPVLNGRPYNEEISTIGLYFPKTETKINLGFKLSP